MCVVPRNGHFRLSRQSFLLHLPNRGERGLIGTHLFAVDLDVRDIVLEHGRHVHLRELVLAEHDQQARLTAGTVPDDDQLLADGCHWFYGIVQEGTESRVISPG